MRRSERCAFCDKPATLLCDFVLGHEILGWTACRGDAALKADRFEEFVPGKGLPYTGAGAKMFTCDAPLCESCTRCIGHTFFDGDKKHTGVERIDLCQLHNGHQNSRTICITAEQAERVRMQTWKRRAMLKVVQSERSLPKKSKSDL
jgi:hypothetical protein